MRVSALFRTIESDPHIIHCSQSINHVDGVANTLRVEMDDASLCLVSPLSDCGWPMKPIRAQVKIVAVLHHFLLLSSLPLLRPSSPILFDPSPSPLSTT